MDGFLTVHLHVRYSVGVENAIFASLVKFSPCNHISIFSTPKRLQTLLINDVHFRSKGGTVQTG